MEAHTFSTIALHKSRIKSISRFPRGPCSVIRRECARKRATEPGLSYTCHSALPTSADITGGIKRLFALMNVVALGHGKIDLFCVMCLSNLHHTFGRHGSLCTSYSDTAIHNT